MLKLRSREVLAIVALFLMAAVAGGPETGRTLAAEKKPAVASGGHQETPAQRDARLSWWREARFGMFIHWGIYAIPAGSWNGKEHERIGEWIQHTAAVPVAEYEKLAGQFNPVEFDAKKWVKIAGDAGMKYIVITSKHHDGFCLWDSAVSTYDIRDATPYKKDLLKALSDACQADGRVRLCFYHSIMDWHHPDAQSINKPGHYSPSAGGKAKEGYQPNPNFPRYVEAYMKPQLKELITKYQPAVMWFDGEWVPEYTEAMGHDVYRFCMGLDPKIIVNNRVGKSRKGMSGMSASAESAGDFGTPEQEIPPTGFPGMDWESCMTMNDTWGFKKNDHNWKSSETLIRNVVETASKGGNFLLNVGPTAEGEIPQPSVERLADIGKWMKVNGASIYGTHASPFEKLAWGRATQKDGVVYLQVYDWPTDGKLRVPLSNEVKKAWLLSSPQKALKATTQGKGVQLDLPAEAPDKYASVIAMEIEGPAKVVAD